VNRGRVAYEPNSLGGGCPFQLGAAGFTSFPQPIKEDKVRGRPEKFADHYTQAQLFFRSQSPVEQAHIIAALRFELTMVQVPAVRERVLAMLANIDDKLVAAVAAGLGMDVPQPLPRALAKPARPEVDVSPSLSLFARPGDGSIRTRRVGILVADGIDSAAATALHERLAELGAVPRYIAATLGPVEANDGQMIEAEVTLETMPSVLLDAIALPGGVEAAKTFATLGHVAECLVNAYRHCKPILALGDSCAVAENAGIRPRLPSGEQDPGLLLYEDSETEAAIVEFVTAIAKHRHFEREMDPPPV